MIIFTPLGKDQPLKKNRLFILIIYFLTSSGQMIPLRYEILLTSKKVFLAI